ncbi:MAG: YDG domain-containing protein, partial [Candidatus Omnitrophota bacterium]
TYTNTALVGSDSLSGALARAAGENVAGGPYAINQGTLSAGTNYSVTFVGNTFAITPKGLTVTASNQTKTYGNSILGSTAFTSVGLQNGETVGGVTLGTNATTSTSGNYNAGSWTITASGAAGGTFDINNYGVSYATGALTIDRKAVTLGGITAANKVYDTTNTATMSGGAFSGMVAGDDLTVSSTGVFSDKNVQESKTVTLTNVLGGADLANYTVTDQGTTTADITAIVTGAVSGIGSGVVLALSKNGDVPVTTTTTDANGSFSFGGHLFVNTGDSILIFVNDGSHIANLVGTVVGPANVTNLTLARGQVSVGSTGAVNLASSYSNSDFTRAKESLSDTAIHYSVASNALSVSGADLYVPQGVVFTPGGDVTASGDLSIAGSLNAGQHTISEGGSWSFGNITNLGNVALTGSGDIVSGGTHFNTLTVSGNYSFADAMAVDGNLNLTAGSLTQNGNLAVAGNYSQASGAFSGDYSKTFTVGGSFSIPDAAGAFNRYQTVSGIKMIRDAYDLQTMKGYLSSDFRLANDINASTATTWNSGAGFDPIGNGTVAFTGALDGNGKVISNLQMNRTGSDYLGLFGNIGASGSVSMLGLENISIYGKDHVGGLAGLNAGSLSNVYTTGPHTVSGVNFVGGLVGSNAGSIANAYSAARVTGTADVGGLAGTNTGAINKTYAMGYVEGSTNKGGLVGSGAGTVTNSFWDKKMTGQTTSAGGTAGKAVLMVADAQGYKIEDPDTVMDTTSPDMMSAATYSGWDFGSTWVMDEGGTYPHFQYRYENGVRGVGGYLYVNTTFNGVTTESKAGAGNTVSLYYSSSVNGSGTYLDSTSTGASSRFYVVLGKTAVGNTDYVIGVGSVPNLSDGSSRMLASSGSIFPLNIWGSENHTVVSPSMPATNIFVDPALEEAVSRTLVDSVIIPVITPTVGTTLPPVTIVDQTGTGDTDQTLT